jgi:hypothetical protein
MRWSLLIVIVWLGAGCALETEPCGIDFVERDGRCVPIDAPPAYYASDAADEDAGFDAGLPEERP